MAMCAKDAEQKHRRRIKEEYHTSMSDYFEAYGRPLKATNYFNYLGRVLDASTDNWTEVANNTRKGWRRWKRFSRILGWEGANTGTYSTSYKTIVQADQYF